MPHIRSFSSIDPTHFFLVGWESLDFVCLVKQWRNRLHSIRSLFLPYRYITCIPGNVLLISWSRWVGKSIQRHWLCKYPLSNRCRSISFSSLSRRSSAICVIVPALIGIGVCAIIYFAHRNKDRKLQRPTSRNRVHADILQEWNESFSPRLRICSLHNARRRSNVKGQRFHARITLETHREIINLCIGTREFSFMIKETERDSEWARGLSSRKHHRSVMALFL